MMRAVLCALVIGAGAAVAQTPAGEKLPAYRARVLGVYNAQTGDPVEGAEVVDLFSKTKAVTTSTGTVSLAFLSEGGAMLRIQKIGFEPYTQVVEITPADTMPSTILLRPLTQTLPTVVTRDSARRHLSPALQAFEERRKAGGGRFIDEATLRKNDTKPMTYMIRQVPGVQIVCDSKNGMASLYCAGVSGRQGSKSAFRGGQCYVDVYIDGVISTDNNLELLRVDEFAGVEYYSGAASIPQQYNKTGSVCGVLLLWRRER